MITHAPNRPEKKIQHFKAFNYVIRDAPRASNEKDMREAYSTKNGVPPAPRVHIDVARKSSRQVIAREFGEDQEQKWWDEGKHTMYFSFWRPLELVQKDPIGVVDCRTVRAADLVLAGRCDNHVARASPMVRVCADNVPRNVPA